MKLQEKLDAYKKGFLKKVPAEALSIMKRATEDLSNSAIMDQTVKIGQKAPDFELKNVDGKDVVLSEQLQKRHGSTRLLSRTMVTVLQHGAGSSDKVK